MFTPDQISALVKIAQAEIGVHEEGGNNEGQRVVEYQKATWMDDTGFAWCAAFIDWCILQWQTQNSDLPEFNRPQTAGAWDLLNWAQKENLLILDPTNQAQAGDIIIFDMHHVGMVTALQMGSYIQTVEGNTTAIGGRETNEGSDGVYAKSRHYSMVKNFIRWKFTTEN